MLSGRAVPSHDHARLHELLDALATESGELACSADALQNLFGRLMDPNAPPPMDALEQAQALDGLVQRLDGLHAFLAGLAGKRLDDLRADVAQVAGGLRLTDQARRFARAGSGAREVLDGGDCDLF